MDTFRDAGFVQGFLDGNWLGDPAIGGAWRYYPPLTHALFAVAAAVTGVAPLTLLISSAPFVNLIVPAGFFVMARTLIGASAAVVGTAMVVYFNGLVLPPWVTAAYHPWSSAPALALGAFFAAVWLLHARAGSARLSDAALLGTAIGLTFLAHTVPALILAVMLPAAVFTRRDMSARTWGWLATAGAVALAWSLPLLLPLVLSYHLHILNPGPGALVDPLFAHWPPGRGMLLTIAPGLAALPLIVALRREGTLSRAAAAILAVWIAVPGAFLARHYACGAAAHSGVCTVFVIAVHHWFIYLQAALTCLAALGAVLCMRRLRRLRDPAWRTGVAWPLAAWCALCALAIFVPRPIDRSMRLRAEDLAGHFDWSTYAWAREDAGPRDLFVTEIADPSLNPASLAIMAAGRRSVALPETYSNPYVDWQPRDDLNAQYLRAARAPDGGQALCGSLLPAAGGADAFVILPNREVTLAPVLQRSAEGGMNSVYRVTPAGCHRREHAAAEL